MAGLLLTGGGTDDTPRPVHVADDTPTADVALSAVDPSAVAPADAQTPLVSSSPAPNTVAVVPAAPAPKADRKPTPTPPPPPAADDDDDDDDGDDYFAKLREQVADRRRKLAIPAEKPPLPDVYITDLTPEYLVVGWGGNPKVNRTICNNPLRVDGTEYANGLGTHSPSDLAYTIEPNYRRFVATVAQDDESADKGAVMFQVFSDDELVAASALMYARKVWHFNVEIPKGSRKIRLVVTDGDDGENQDHADWLNAGFVAQ